VTVDDRPPGPRARCESGAADGAGAAGLIAMQPDALALDAKDIETNSFRLAIKTASDALCRTTIVGPGTEGWPSRNVLRTPPPGDARERFTVFDGLVPGGTYHVLATCADARAELTVTTRAG
jgi:hypothetical protein